MSKVDKARLQEVFESYPNAKSLFVTSDGTIFTDKNKSFAKQHAASSKLTCEEITREDFEAGKTPSSKTAEAKADWKKAQKSILAYAETLEGFKMPGTAKSNAARIEAIEAFLAEKEAEEGSEGDDTEKGAAAAEGTNAVTNHQTQE